MKNILLVLKIVPKWRKGIYKYLNKKFLERGYNLIIVYDYNALTMSNHKSCGKLKFTKSYNYKLINLLNIIDFYSVKKSLKELKPTIVISDANPRFLTNLQLFYYKRKYQYKIFGWSSGYFQNFNIIKDYYRNKFFSRFDGIISYHKKAANIFKERYNQNKILVAGNSIDNFKLEKEIKKYDKRYIKKLKNNLLKGSEVLILFVGKLTEQKNVDKLLLAAKILGEKYQFVIIGDGPEKENLFKKANNLSLNNVSFLGSIYEGVNKYFQAADIFVMPGLGGLAIIQALYNGLPIITTPGDGIGFEAIANNENGYITENMSPDFIVNKIKRLTNSKLRDSFSKKSFELSKKFNIDTITNKIVNFVLN